jgi:hypothetical protein
MATAFVFFKLQNREGTAWSQMSPVIVLCLGTGAQKKKLNPLVLAAPAQHSRVGTRYFTSVNHK